jgi:hypothetical protein
MKRMMNLIYLKGQGSRCIVREAGKGKVIMGINKCRISSCIARLRIIQPFKIGLGLVLIIIWLHMMKHINLLRII